MIFDGNSYIFDSSCFFNSRRGERARNEKIVVVVVGKVE